MFTIWSGGLRDATNPSSVIVDSDTTVTGNFDLIYMAKLLVAGTLQASIQDGCDAADDGETLLAQEYIFQEPSGVTLGLNKAKTVTIIGGLDKTYLDYVSTTSMTTVKGPVNIRQGLLNVQRLNVRP